MTSAAEGEDAGDDPVERLFDEWLSARERGDEVDLEALVARAGTRAEVLRRRIQVYESLESFGGGAPARESEQTRIGRFQILRPLGKGGLGSVYLALDPELKREVAIKVLNPDASDGRGWILNEARSLARIHHPSVVRVYEVLRSGPSQIVAMEHLAGPTLTDVIEELKLLRRELMETKVADPDSERSVLRMTAERLEPLSARVRVLGHLADALAHCHDRGILHRDVKPANVMFDEKVQPRLIDFGLAHQGADGDSDTSLDITQSLVASPAYMAPEQIESERTGADPRTDQFSFAVCAYEFLTLQHPFVTERRATTLDAIARARPTRLTRLEATIPADLERVILHALERDPGDRYPSMQALCEDLHAVLEHRPVSISRLSPLHWLRLFLRRHRRVVQIAVAAFVLLVGLAIGQRVRALTQQRDEARAELVTLASPASDSTDPVVLYEQCRTYLRLRSTAERLEAGLVELDLFPDLEAFAEALGARVSDGAADVAGRFIPSPPPYAMSDWLRCIELLEEQAPEVPLSATLGGISLVELDPVGLEGMEPHWLRFEPAGGPGDPLRSLFGSLHEAVVPARPAPGQYRVLFTDPTDRKVAAEAVVHLPRLWRKAERISIRPPEARSFEDALELPRTRLALRKGFPTLGAEDRFEPALVVPAARILGQVVTRRELEAFCLEEGRVPHRQDSYPAWHGPEDPAWASPEEARRFARAKGGRLPTVFELMLAERTGRFTGDPLYYDSAPEEDPGVSLVAEWVEAGGSRWDATRNVVYNLFPLEVTSKSSTFPFNRATEGLEENDWMHSLLVRNPDATVKRLADTGIGFRIVFPDDTLDAYLAGIEEPD